jgi:hypothetical protein
VRGTYRPVLHNEGKDTEWQKKGRRGGEGGGRGGGVKRKEEGFGASRQEEGDLQLRFFLSANTKAQPL